LVQQGMYKVLARKTKKPMDMTDKDWEDLNVISLSTIRMCLVDDILFNIIGEETTTDLWSRIESIYMKNSLTN